MKLQINVEKAPFAVVSDGGNMIHLCGTRLELDPSMGNTLPGRSICIYWCRNVTVAEVENIQRACGVGVGDDVAGVKVKSRYVRKFVGLGNPEWRG